MSLNLELSPLAAVMTRGVISDLHTFSWMGEMTAGAKTSAGIDFSLGKELKFLLPSAHLRNIRSLMCVRRRAFMCYTLGCSWGRFMPARAIKEWMRAEQEFSSRLTELSEMIVSDRRHILDSIKVRARQQAMEIWKKKGNKGEATVPFCMAVENVLVELVPKEDRLRDSYRFYTDYHSVPPVSFGNTSDESVLEIMNSHYGPVLDRLGGIFVREIMSDLKNRVIEACETLRQNESKTTGRIRESSLRRFESFLEVLKVLWTSSDGKVDKIIINLQKDLEMCYTDHSLIIKKADSLAAIAVDTLNASSIEL